MVACGFFPVEGAMTPIPVPHPRGAGQFVASLDAVLADVGIRVVRTLPRSPRVNCFAERFVRPVRAELTDRILMVSQRHVPLVLTEYVRHYNGRRPHRARERHPPQPNHPVADLSHERIKRHRFWVA
jgi:putative transposase